MLSYIAKALTAFLLSLVIMYATDHGIEIDSEALEILIGSGVVGFFTWLVPNRKSPAETGG
jgi:fluoride ion exporter CrcB/FEX